MRPRWPRRGVRLSLALWHVCALVVVLALYAANVFTFVNRNVTKALDDRLRGDFQWAAEMSEEKPDGTLSWFESSGSGEDTDSPWLQVWAQDGTLIFRSALASRLPITSGLDAVRGRDASVTSAWSGAGRYRVLTGPSRVGGRPITIQVARSEEPGRQELRRLVLILALGFPLCIAVAGCGGYLLARRALLPLDRMANHARAITAERLGERLPVDNPSDELGRLAIVFNETLGRLESSFERMRRFTADVSHELRTPLTAMRSVGEVGLRGTRDETGYRRVIGSMLEEVDRLTRLVERLLAWSRTENDHPRLSVEAFDLGLLVEEVVGDVGVLAEEKGQAMSVDRAGAAPCLADRRLLRQALVNLVDNAIKYTPEGGQIRLRVNEVPDAVHLDVTDTGPGIPVGPRARIFDRFYQNVGARSIARTGAGLGLFIAKWAVEVNGGDLSVAPADGGGTTFRISLPAVRLSPLCREGAVPVHH